MTAINASDLPHGARTGATDHAAEVYGLIGEYDNVDAVIDAARRVRDAGYKRFDVHSPFPVHGIDEAIGVRPTLLPWVVLICGLTGTLTALVLTHYTMGITPDMEMMPESFKGYQYFVAGKPFFATPAYIPPIFELTILFASFGATFGMFIMNRLPLLAHPLFRSARFRRVTTDRFFLAIEARDGAFDEQRTADLLRESGALSVEKVTE